MKILLILGLNPSYQQYARRYSSSAPPRQQRNAAPFDWTHTNFDKRRSYQQRSNTNESDW